MSIKEILKLTGIPVLVASMCCLSPIIFVLLGVVSVSAAGELADVFYGTYKWVFRLVGLFALLLSIWFYFRKQGVCSLDQAKRHKNKILNTLLLTLSIGILGYVFFLYVVVHYFGVWLKIWN